MASSKRWARHHTTIIQGQSAGSIAHVYIGPVTAKTNQPSWSIDLKEYQRILQACTGTNREHLQIVAAWYKSTRFSLALGQLSCVGQSKLPKTYLPQYSRYQYSRPSAG